MEKKLNGKIETPKTITDKRLLNLKPAWKKGDPSPNPKGHPLGQRNYDTIRREALIAIGKKNGKTPNEIENMLIEAGLSQAMRGDFRYYKDDLDRRHGQAKQQMEHSGEIKNYLTEEQIDEIINRRRKKMDSSGTPRSN